MQHATTAEAASTSVRPESRITTLPTEILDLITLHLYEWDNPWRLGAHMSPHLFHAEG